MAGVRRGAAVASTALPVAEAPVSTIKSTPASIAARPASPVSPNTESNFGGSPARASASASSAIGAAQPGAGFSSTALPAARACTACTPGNSKG